VKAHSPLLGFNNNVKHKGRVFHIQTEDSGARHPHIITHLFADGGRILKTTKTSYAEHVGADRMADTVRAMMKEQHKAMFIALRDGEFDHLFDEIPLAGRPSAAGNPAMAPTVPAPADGAAEAAAPAPPPPAAEAKPPPPAAVVAVPAGARANPMAPTATATPAQTGAGSAPDLDLEHMERAAAEKQSPVFQQIHDLPPPPAAVLGKKRGSEQSATAGSYRTVTPAQTSHVVSPPPAPPADKGDSKGGKPAVPSTGRYAPTRPAAIFANSRPAEGASIFGEDLISEKSLDEVILSYLAEDLDSQPPKK